MELLFESFNARVRDVVMNRAALEQVVKSVRSLKVRKNRVDSLVEPLAEIIQIEDRALRNKLAQISGGNKETQIMKLYIHTLQDYFNAISSVKGADDQFSKIERLFNKASGSLVSNTKKTRTIMDNVIKFVKAAWGSGAQEMIYVLTLLSTDMDCVKFIKDYGCNEYFANNSGMLVGDIREEIKNEIAEEIKEALAV